MTAAGESEPQDHIREVAAQNAAFVDGIRYLGTLLDFPVERIEADMQKPLSLLFDLASVRMTLGGRDRALPDQFAAAFPALAWLSANLSDMDRRHTVASLGYLIRIADGEEFSREEKKISMSAMIVHDCAYPQTKNFSEFTSGDVRLRHMQEAVAEFRRFASRVNDRFAGFYTEAEIETICAIVIQHDNPGIKENGKPLGFTYDPPPRKLMWAQREADRLWMLDKGGFALDLVRRLVEGTQWFDPGKYLKENVIRVHESEGAAYEDPAVIQYLGNPTLYRTRTGFALFTELVSDRMREYAISSD